MFIPIQIEDIEMNDETDATSNLPSQQQLNEDPALSNGSSVEVIDEQNESATKRVEENSNKSSEQEPVTQSTGGETQQGETMKIVVEDGTEEKPLTSPPRKSARLSAKRRDSTTDSDISIVTKSESPVPRRRSLRRNSTSSQDATPIKAKEEPAKKLPTIVETSDQFDGNAKQTTSDSTDSETQKNEKALVDELAAAFVEEFIDDDE